MYFFFLYLLLIHFYYLKEIDNLKNELVLKNAEISELKQSLNQKNNKIKKLNNKINELQRLNNQLTQQNEMAQNMTANINPWDNNQIIQSFVQLIKTNQIGLVGCESLNLGEKLIVVNITSGDSSINFPVICKADTEFKDIERKLYQKYPEYKKNDDKDNVFLDNGQQINRLETMAQNGFKDYSITLMKKD